MERYDHTKIEKKWQQRWEKERSFAALDDSTRDKYYLLVEFPYPSGNLHVGHWYAFSVPDMYARYLRLTGKNVLFPIGFDAFGLPAENAAIKRGLNPRAWTYDNMAHMREQIRSMGASFDWSREVVTCDPAYYKWTQWQFIELYKRGLVYRKETAVNWCPNDKTVLANEQVVGGKCERCGAEVEQRLMPQWNIKITAYADRLIDDLEPLNWPKQIKDSQSNWIGRSEGAEIGFALKFYTHPEDNDRRGPNGEAAALTVFTTRPDTLFGATYLVLAPEHPWVGLATDPHHDVLENKAEVAAYLAQAKRKTELERQESKEKTGVELKGVKAINPATQEEIPIFVADYVLGGYGTGAIMAVPAHDERDYEFATAFHLPIRQVIMPSLVDESNPPQEGKENTFRNMILAIVHDPKTNRYLTLKWTNQQWTGFITGGVEEGENRVDAAKREIAEETGYTNVRLVRSLGMTEAFFYAGHKGVNRKTHGEHFLFELLDDTRIPVSPEEERQHTVVWLSQDEIEKTHIQHAEFALLWQRIQTGKDLYTGPGILMHSGQFDGMGSEEAKEAITQFVGGRMTKQYHLRDWVVSRQRYWGVPIPMLYCTACAAQGEHDGWHPVPEDQLPVVLPDITDYLPTGDGKSPLAKVASFVEATCPACGGPATRETDTLDTFVDSSWYFLRYADPHNSKTFASEALLAKWLPIDLYSGGSEHTTMHVLYSRFWNKALFDAGLVPTSEPYSRRMNRGLIMGPDGQKMSKSKGNVIDPDEVVSQLGADTVRMYLAFIGPYNEVGSYPWNPNGAIGVRRFLERVWNLAGKIQKMPPEKDALSDATAQALQATIKKVTDSIESLKMNTAVSALMEFTNHLWAQEQPSRDAYETLLALLSPFAPHIACELAEKMDFEPGQWQQWPQADLMVLAPQKATVAVQINGKVRATLALPADLGEAEALAAARADERVAKWLGAGQERKAVYVPGRIINFVVAPH